MEIPSETVSSVDDALAHRGVLFRKLLLRIPISSQVHESDLDSEARLAPGTDQQCSGGRYPFDGCRSVLRGIWLFGAAGHAH